MLCLTNNKVQGVQFINMHHLNFITIPPCKTHNTLRSHLNKRSMVHNHIHIHQTILNGEHQHIKMFVLLLKIFEHLLIPIQNRDLKEVKDLWNNFTLIGESYTSLYEKLKPLNMIESIPQHFADPRSKGFNSLARCAYHCDALRYNIEDFELWKVKW